MLRLPRRASSRLLVPVLLSAVIVSVSALPASASAAGDTISYTNAARADHGLRRLSVASDLTRLAQQHASWMASHRRLEHTSNLGGTVCCWVSVGENVGYGGTARQVFNAFMGSSSHRANILSSRYTQIGVGTARASNGYLYVDQIFRLPKGSTSSSSSATPTTTRASRSSTRTPLHLAPRISATQQRDAQLALRVSKLRYRPVGDPMRRSLLWMRSMVLVTAG